MHVTTLAAPPGMLTSTEVVEPPYIAPYQMPVIMMSPVTGPYGIVNGRRSAIVAVGPSPGSTPTIVPMSAPPKQAMRLTAVKELANPVRRRSKPPMSLESEQETAWQDDVQTMVENEVDEKRYADGDFEWLSPAFELHRLAERERRQ